MTEFVALHPPDEHNLRLEANVHPPDWVQPTPAGRYNLVVIGAGTAGLVTAAGAAGLGAKVALVERSLMGGDCLNVGCVPSKALISSARVAAGMRRAEEFGIQAPSEIEVNFGQVMSRMRELRADISPHDSAARFRELGIDVYLGSAEFTSPGQVQVGDIRLDYKRAVIATGGRATVPPIDGLQDVEYLTNETIFSLTDLPPRLGVIGAGPIGCEMAQTFARLGSQVHLFEATHGILPREDRQAADVVKASILNDGVRLYCCGKEMRIQNEGGEVRIIVQSHDTAYDVVVDKLFVAAGRAPNVENLGLDKVGVNYDRSGVTVDDRLRTTNRRIFAAGDVCSRFKFTHAADFMARTVIQNALFMGRGKASALNIPWATYTSPEIAHIGLYQHEAEQQGVAIDTYLQPMDGVDRAILEGETAGFVKVVTKKGSDKILGATIVAPHAGDMIGAVSLAMKGKLGLKTLGGAIHPYPTQADALRKIGDQFNRTRLTPFVKGLFARWLKWTR